MQKNLVKLISVLLAASLACSCSKEERAALHPKGSPMEDYPNTLEFSSEPGTAALEFKSNVILEGTVYTSQYGTCIWRSDRAACNEHDWISLSGTSTQKGRTEFYTTISISVSENTIGAMRTDTLFVETKKNGIFPPSILVAKYAIVQH